jgi:hypothetical protein
MSRYSDKALAALRAMGIEPDKTQRVVIDMRNDGSVLVHRTVALGRLDEFDDLLDAVAEIPPHILPAATPLTDEMAEIDARIRVVHDAVRELDALLLDAAPAELARAYRRLVERAPWS